MPKNFGKRKSRGGFFGFGSILNQAAVPGTLLAMQNRYRRKSGGKKNTKKIRGGGGATGYGNYMSGPSTNSQLTRTFNSNNSNGNALMLNNGTTVGGSRKTKRGGQWGQVFNQAVVPAALLAMQQSYRRRGSYSNKFQTKRRR
jgi:hypothetical protein